MNRVFLITAALVIFIVAAFLLLQGDIIGKRVTGKFPAPAEEDLTNHQKRERWLEEMHLAAPGINWRMMNLRHRLGRMEQYLKAGRHGSRSGVVIGGLLDGTWQERGSRNQSGRIHVAELDHQNQVLYCASSGGQIWRTPLGTPQWEVLTDHFQVKGIHMLRVLPNGTGNRFLIASDAFSTPGFYYSDDTCATWQPATGTILGSWGYVRRAVVANDSINTVYILALGWSGAATVRILKSTDLGESFQEVLSFPENQVGSIRNCDIWTDRYGTGRIFFAKATELYELVQGVPALRGSFATSYQQQVRLTGYERGGGASLYVLQVNAGSGGGAVYKSENSGVTWSFKGSVQESPFMMNSFACSATNPAVVYFGGVEAYRSLNSGATWIKKNGWQDYYSNVTSALHADIPGLCSFMTTQGEVLFICTDGGIYRSDNSMQSVTNLSLTDLNVSQYYSVYTSRVNTSFIHAGSQDQGYQRTNSTLSSALDFDQIWSGDYGHIVSGDGGQSIWMNYPGFTVFYDDVLNTTSRTWSQFDFSNALWLPPMMINPHDKYSVVIGGGNLGGAGGAWLINYSLNGIGSPMTYFDYPYDFSGGSTSARVSAVASSPLDKDCWYVLTTNGKFFHSADAGSNWVMKQDFNFSFGHYFYGADILPSPNEKGKVYICGSGYSNPPVFELTEYGANVKALDAGIPSTLVYALDCTPEEGLIFAATELGPYVYISSLEQWFDLSEGSAPDQTYWSVDYVESLKCARFGTYGRGIWDFKMCGTAGNQPLSQFSQAAGNAYLEVLFQDLSTGDPFTWLWDFGDGKTSVSQNPVHIYTTPGTYTVKLITGNICNRDTIVKTIQVTQTGIIENDPELSLTLYPNPASGILYVNIHGIRNEEIAIYDFQGRAVASSFVKSGGSTYKIDVSSLSNGTYFLSLIYEGKRLTRKVLISN